MTWLSNWDANEYHARTPVAASRRLSWAHSVQGSDDNGVVMIDDFESITHVDDFINDHKQDKYARFCFLLFRLSAHLKADFEEFTRQCTLFCMYEGKPYRVTGASRLGDIWLTSKFDQDIGHELRVNVAECSAWSKTPMGLTATAYRAAP